MNTFGMAWRQRAARLAVVTLGAAALMLVGLYGANSASADPYPPTQGCGIVAGTANVTPGESVTLTGSGFTANSTIGLTIESSPQSLGSVDANASGAFRDTVTLPGNLTAGEHTVLADGANQTCTLTLSVGTHGISAVHADAPHHGSGGSSDGLASTGVKIAAIGTLALVLLGGGALLLVAGRRRKA